MVLSPNKPSHPRFTRSNGLTGNFVPSSAVQAQKTMGLGIWIGENPVGEGGR